MKRFLHDNLHCICAMITMLFFCFLLCFELDVFAAGINFSSGTYADNWDIDPDDITISTRDNYIIYLEGLGYTNFSINTNDINNNSHGNIVNFVSNALFPSSYDDGTVVHDLTNCPFFIGSSSAYNEYGVYFILDKSYADIENEFISFTCDSHRIRSLVNQSILFLSYNSSYTYVSYSVYTMTLNSTRTSYFYTTDIKYFYNILSNAIICFPTSGIPGNYENSQVYSESNCLNFNLNYDLFRSSPTPPEPEDNFAPIAKHYLTFNDSTNYVYSAYVGSNTPVTIVHKNDFRFNEQQILNPTYYNLRFSYVITYQDTTMLNPEYFFYEVDGVQLALVLGQLNRLGGTHDVPIPFSDCVNISGTRNLNQQLKLLEESVTNTDYNYTNPWDIFTDLGNSVLGNSISVGSTFVPYINKFDISGSVVIYDKNNPTYISGTHEDKEDFVNGEFTLVSNANTQNLYPIPEGEDLPPSVIAGQGSSNTSNYNAPIANGGQVVNNIYPSTNYYKPYVLDEVTVAGVANQWNYMIRTMQNTDSNNSFWGVIKNVYDYIPREIWGWVWAALASILGCAVFRFYINTIRI